MEDRDGQAWIAIELSAAKTIGCVKLYQALAARAHSLRAHHPPLAYLRKRARSLPQAHAHTRTLSEGPHPPLTSTAPSASQRS